MAEALGMPGFETVAWHVLLAPAKTPRPIVKRLHTEMQRIASDPAFQERVLKIGLLPAPPRSIEEIKQYIEDQRVRWGGMVTKLGLAGSH
jgi:tripartite-type tricarboxylate transporter receptor subunit TctC